MTREKIIRWTCDRRAQLVGTLPVIVFFIALFWVVQLGFGDQYLLAVSPFTTLFETRLTKYNPPSQYARFFLVSALALVGARVAVTNVALCVAVNLAMPFALVFMRSSQLNPRRYFPYTMLFAFLQLRPGNLVTSFATQAAVLAACCAALSARPASLACAASRAAMAWRSSPITDHTGSSSHQPHNVSRGASVLGCEVDCTRANASWSACSS